MNFKEWMQQLLSLGVAGFGLVAALFHLSTPHGGFAPFMIMGLLPMLVGSGAFYHFRKKLQKRLLNKRELNILRLMKFHGRAYSLAELAIETGMPVGDIKKLLENLQEQGALEVQAAHNGTVIYSLNEAPVLRQSY